VCVCVCVCVWCDYEGAMPAWLPDARVSLASPPSLLPAAGMLYWVRIPGDGASPCASWQRGGGADPSDAPRLFISVAAAAATPVLLHPHASHSFAAVPQLLGGEVASTSAATPSHLKSRSRRLPRRHRHRGSTSFPHPSGARRHQRHLWWGPPVVFKVQGPRSCHLDHGFDAGF
jgi:hypothetical protein